MGISQSYISEKTFLIKLKDSSSTMLPTGYFCMTFSIRAAMLFVFCSLATEVKLPDVSSLPSLISALIFIMQLSIYLS